ncbi:MAG: pantoate--beta-alanine ligase [Bacteroidota bacterium]
MEICRYNKQLEEYLLKQEGITGFVPTMGALHEGHLSLIEAAKKNTDKVISSIFVNPTQFNDKRDLANYPRMPEKDIQLLQNAGCDCVYIPSVEEVYPPDFKQLEVDFGHLENTMEGSYRPGHFKGVATVVNRLFELVKPDEAFFGEKDFQQLAVIRELAKRYHPKIKINGCATVREADGLAMSSRNMLLTPEQRAEAPLIYKVLTQADAWIQNHSVSSTINMLTEMLNQSKFLRLQYFDIVHPLTLVSITDATKVKGMRGCIAVLTDGPRLIDNMEFELNN